MGRFKNRFLLAMAAWGVASAAHATLVATPTGPFAQLDDQFTAELFSTNTNGFIGMSWLSDGRMIRADGGSGFYVHSATADTTINGTSSLHSATYQSITGFSGSGYGLTRGNDGFFYQQSWAGLQKIDPVTFVATTVVGSAGGTYGVKTMPDGKIVYNANDGWVHLYDPGSGIDNSIYYSNSFNDDIAVSPDGHIIVAALTSCRTDIITSTGTVVNTVASSHCADGMAYGQGNIFKNNTDGTLTRLSFAGAGFTGAATEDVIATGYYYGDLAAVGPDNSFYITGYDFKYADGSSAGAWAVARISAVGGGGFGEELPEPASLALMGVALGMLAVTRRRNAKA